LITIVGLGPANAGSLSVAARDALRAAPCLLLRTDIHPAAEELKAEGLEYETLDSIYEFASSFDSLYTELAARVLAIAKDKDVVYAVPGHPLIGEESIRRLMSMAREQSVPVRIIGSESFIEPALAALQVSVGDGLLILDALSLPDAALRPETPTLFYQVYNSETAAALKLALMREYPDDYEISVVHSAGVSGHENVEVIPLHRLDRAKVDHLTSVFVPALSMPQRRKGFADLVWVMARLRGEGGCPWDREQDHKTLKRYMVEECYEAIEAIDADDMDALEEELGDVLLQVVFHAQLEAEVGTFTIDDVTARIVDKLIRRHPHVFGDLNVADSDEVLRNWEQIKKGEKGEGWRESVLDGVPAGLPALTRAMEISKRAVKVGFEWEKLEDVLGKLDEEVLELREAIHSAGSEEIADEIGDLLFTVVNVARWLKLDPEDALRLMLRRFTERFQYIEKAAAAQGRKLTDMSLAEMDALWNEAKAGAQLT
jgi:tetrapyrrole methylase family protein/MazG family protein